MKFYQKSLPLLFVFALIGCIGDNMGSCPEIPENNLVLEFVHTDAAGTDIFPGNIHRADVFVFNPDGNLVLRQRMEKEALSVFAGTELSLPAGTYRVVCWGNAYDKTSLGGAFVGFGIPDANAIATGGYPLYYAPYTQTQSPAQAFTVTVPEQGVETAVVNFRSAHIKIEVYIKGFVDQSTQAGQPLLPLVELTDQPSGYDYDMQASGPVLTYRDVAAARTVEGQQLAVTGFYTPLFGEDTPVRAIIKQQSDGSTVATVSLKDFIRDNHITLSVATEVVIPIFVDLEKGGIHITLPQWDENPITPR